MLGMLALGLSPMVSVMAAEGGSSKLALAPVKGKKLPAGVQDAMKKVIMPTFRPLWQRL